jgi:putative GTP pyrophosphokinase
MSIRFSTEEFEKMKKLLPVYKWGLSTLRTKLDIIDEDLKNSQNSRSIEYIASRIKAPESIAQKLHEMGLAVTADNAQKHLWDIAGIRIICPFAKDIHYLTEIIRSMPAVNILEEKDFVSNPKPSGYRSYHLIVKIPVFYSGETRNVAVEVQIRTSAMNFWATLEHRVRYKYREHIPDHLSDELVVIADKIAELDNRMFTIHDIITLINDSKED